VAVRLSDVAPDGAAPRVPYGVLNLTHQDGARRLAPRGPAASAGERAWRFWSTPIVARMRRLRFPSGLSGVSHASFSVIAGNAVTGWPTDEKLEALRLKCLDTSDLAEQQAICRQMQQQAFVSVSGRFRLPSARSGPASSTRRSRCSGMSSRHRRKDGQSTGYSRTPGGRQAARA